MNTKTLLFVLFAIFSITHAGISTKIINFCITKVLCLGCPFSSGKAKVEKAPKEVADPETTTPNGCTCTSLCGATVEDAFTVSN